MDSMGGGIILCCVRCLTEPHSHSVSLKIFSFYKWKYIHCCCFWLIAIHGSVTLRWGHFFLEGWPQCLTYTNSLFALVFLNLGYSVIQLHKIGYLTAGKRFILIYFPLTLTQYKHTYIIICDCVLNIKNKNKNKNQLFFHDPSALDYGKIFVSFFYHTNLFIRFTCCCRVQRPVCLLRLFVCMFMRLSVHGFLLLLLFCLFLVSKSE